jgi:hypothetical protein
MEALYNNQELESLLWSVDGIPLDSELYSLNFDPSSMGTFDFQNLVGMDSLPLLQDDGSPMTQIATPDLVDGEQEARFTYELGKANQQIKDLQQE